MSSLKDGLASDLKKAGQYVTKAIRQMDADELKLSDLGGIYLRRVSQRPTTRLATDSHMIRLAMENSDVDRKDMVFVDYGGGIGIMSMLAKRIGVGKVIFVDLYEAFCQDAQRIAAAAGLEADHYVQGSIEALNEFLAAKNLSCDCIASYDVIEHVYNLEDFFSKVAAVSKSALSVAMGSGANARNPMTSRALKKGHYREEYQGCPRMWGQGLRDTQRSYLAVRTDIIHQHAPQLSQSEVAGLAKATRGLIKPEIESCVDDYIRVGKIARTPDHPTNTCCPYTGFWAERLLDPDYVGGLLVPFGFTTKMLCGHYAGGSGSPIKVFLGSCLNVVIRLLGSRCGFFFAPYLVLVATRGPVGEQ